MYFKRQAQQAYWPLPIALIVNLPVLSNNPVTRMKVLLYHFTPFSLAHGGQQIQILRTAQGLRNAGVDASFLDWHNETQRADLLHFFGRIPPALLRLAHQKGWKVVVADLLAAQGARSSGRRSLEKLSRRFLERMLPSGPRETLGWLSYRSADACIALTPWEKQLLEEHFDVHASRVHIVPNGVDREFFEAVDAPRGDWLLCVATIAPVKRVLEIAQAAVAAQTPLKFVGRPYSEQDSYVREFREFVGAHPKLLCAEGPVEDRSQLAQLYREAKGFILLSNWESQSLAALEAAACKCPLLLRDLSWARTTFGNGATYCPPGLSVAAEAAYLRAFYDQAAKLPAPPRPLTWDEVGAQLAGVYRAVLKPS